MAGSGRYSRTSGFEVRVRMAQTHAYSAPGSFGDHLRRSLEFWCNRHHSNMAARRLPQSIECLERWKKQVLWRMNPAASMAQEWTFQMYSKRLGAACTITSVLFGALDLGC
jgi:hypothetical protein